MQSLLEYLASAPKNHLAKLHRRDHPEAGLQKASLVVEAVQARAMDPERLQEVLRKLEKEGRKLLLAIYAAEERGVLESEMLRGCESGPAQAGYWLGLLEYELLIHCREGETRSYHGFREMSPRLMPVLLTELVPPSPAPTATAWVSNAGHSTSHLCHALAKAARGDLRMTQSGEMHRKSLQDLGNGFASGEPLSSSIAAEEAVFLFRFAADAGLLLVDEEGVLRLSHGVAAWLEEGREELARKLWEWWLRKRMRGMSSTLRILAESQSAENAAYEVASLTPLFSVYEGWEKPRGKPAELMTWENLPRALRELWMLGGADFAMHKGRIRWVRFRAGVGEGAPVSAGSEPPRGLPNMEALVPIAAPLNRQFQVELLAGRDNDEVLTRYRFTKDSVVEGLRAGLTAEALQEVASWLGFENAARRTLSEWASSYVSSVFREIFMLRVHDAHRFRELEDFPQFMELVREVIPGYGFVLPKSAKSQARELLRVFDLLPGEEAAAEKAWQPAVPDPADPAWSLPTFNHGEIVYRHALPVRRELPNLSDRGSRPKVEETLAQRLQTLENAIHQQRNVEFSLAGAIGSRLQVQPLHVLRNRDPIKLIGVEIGSGHRKEFVVEQTQGLRILESG